MDHARDRHLRQGRIGEQMIDAGAEIDDRLQIRKAAPAGRAADSRRRRRRYRAGSPIASGQTRNVAAPGDGAQSLDPFAGLRPVDGDEDGAHRAARSRRRGRD